MRALTVVFVMPLALGLGSCVDTSGRCHTPVVWKPCAGAAAQPGASGAPPSIVALTLPSCVFLDDPQAGGTLVVDDADGDAQLTKVSFYAGPRVDEVEVPLDDAGRNGTGWSGNVSLFVPGVMPQASEISYDVRVKVTDRAGNQSAPVCNTFTLVH